eukprot:2735025-Amphidinium_carterae.1
MAQSVVNAAAAAAAAITLFFVPILQQSYLDHPTTTLVHLRLCGSRAYQTCCANSVRTTPKQGNVFTDFCLHQCTCNSLHGSRTPVYNKPLCDR